MSTWFQYQELDLRRHEFRLCRFRTRSKASEAISCELRHFDSDSRECPGYRALSYEWGPPSPLVNIYVNEHLFSVRRNLFDYLEQCECRRDCGSWIWIDQISIDQSNTKERNHQVQAMQKIYGRAAAVVAWVGPSDEDSDNILQIQERPEFTNDDFDPTGAKLSLVPVMGTTKYSISQRLSAINFLKRRYFGRLWIVQEILLAQHVVVVCGRSAAIPWTSLQQLVSNLSLAMVLPQAVIGLFRFSQGHTNYELKDVLVFSANACEDPRDRVYGLQGLVKPSQQIIVNYDRTTEGVLIDVAYALISQTGSSTARDLIPDLARSMVGNRNKSINGFVWHMVETFQVLSYWQDHKWRNHWSDDLTSILAGDVIKRSRAQLSSSSPKADPFGLECETCGLVFRSTRLLYQHKNDYLSDVRVCYLRQQNAFINDI